MCWEEFWSLSLDSIWKEFGVDILDSPKVEENDDVYAIQYTLLPPPKEAWSLGERCCSHTGIRSFGRWVTLHIYNCAQHNKYFSLPWLPYSVGTILLTQLGWWNWEFRPDMRVSTLQPCAVWAPECRESALRYGNRTVRQRPLLAPYRASLYQLHC